MWALWRVHDVFEAGTAARRRRRGRARALARCPTARSRPARRSRPSCRFRRRPMAPMPSKVEIVERAGAAGRRSGIPGYPFFIPGVAGHRAPHPPLDFAVDRRARSYDGGLPRHVVSGGTRGARASHARLDWSKDARPRSRAVQLPEGGTPSEKRAMKFFARRGTPASRREGQPAPFSVNGLPRGPQPARRSPIPPSSTAGPSAPPSASTRAATSSSTSCSTRRAGTSRSSASRAVGRRAGPASPARSRPSRSSSAPTSDDVRRVLAHQPGARLLRARRLPGAHADRHPRPAHPPGEVRRAPSDGAANGFNYEDGTFSPKEVRERIAAINAQRRPVRTAGSARSRRSSSRRRIARARRRAGRAAWVGAQATVQRWCVDPLTDTPPRQGPHYMTVFTHDHFGPSTHQQVGLYGGLLVEPAGTDVDLARRHDRASARATTAGRPATRRTSSSAIRRAAGQATASSRSSGATRSRSTGRRAAQAAGLLQLRVPKARRTRSGRPTSTASRWPPGRATRAGPTRRTSLNCPRCPTTASARNPSGGGPNPPQPLAGRRLRRRHDVDELPQRAAAAARQQAASGVNPAAGADGGRSGLTPSARFRASIPRSARQPAPGAQIDACCSGRGCFRFPMPPISAGMEPTDPYTPMLHGYEGDKVQIRLLAARTRRCTTSPCTACAGRRSRSTENSGYRNSQFIMLSEHFEMLFQLPRPARVRPPTTSTTRARRTRG